MKSVNFNTIDDYGNKLEKLLQIVFRRILKIIANGLKGVFYLHYKLAPDKRYTIPASSKPLLQSRKVRKIPPILWQTNHTNRVTLAVYANFLFNRLMSPTFEHRYHSDAECNSYVAQHYPGETFELFDSLQIGAARADFWRVLVLENEGGIYIDFDANMSWFAERFLDADQHDLFLDMGAEITNYFLASAPGNPAMQEIRQQISKNIQENTLTSVYHMTGPTVVDQIVRQRKATIRPYRQVATQGQFTNKLFQYADKKRGGWGQEQQDRSIVKAGE